MVWTTSCSTGSAGDVGHGTACVDNDGEFLRRRAQVQTRIEIAVRSVEERKLSERAESKIIDYK